MRTPKNIVRHELIGVHAEVVESSNKDNVGISGKIVDETQKTLTIKTAKGLKKIQKSVVTLKLMFDGYTVLVRGKALYGRPEDRIKKKIKYW